MFQLSFNRKALKNNYFRSYLLQIMWNDIIFKARCFLYNALKYMITFFFLKRCKPKCATVVYKYTNCNSPARLLYLLHKKPWKSKQTGVGTCGDLRNHTHILPNVYWSRAFSLAEFHRKICGSAASHVLATLPCVDDENNFLLWNLFSCLGDLVSQTPMPLSGRLVYCSTLMAGAGCVLSLCPGGLNFFCFLLCVYRVFLHKLVMIEHNVR